METCEPAISCVPVSRTKSKQILMVPTEGVETAKRSSRVFACVCNRLPERKLRSQRQNAPNASKRTETKGNEKFLSSIVIKKVLPLVILCALSIDSCKVRTD